MFYCKFTVLWMILQTLASLGLTQAHPNNSYVYIASYSIQLFEPVGHKHNKDPTNSMILTTM